MATDIATLGIRIDSNDVPTATNRLDGLAKSGKQAESAINPLSKTFDALKGYILAAAAALAAFKLIDFIKDATLAAARAETLGVAMRVVGNNAGYTGAQMDAYEKQVRSMGIATIEARESLTKMAGAQMDLSKASGLARVAQDAAVIGGINSSDAFARMIQGIRSGETEVLKTIGINVQFEQAYKKSAAALGKNADALTAQEKVAARLNAVMEYGVNISGAYEAAMGTTGKQITSLKRYYDDLKIAFGEAFSPALGVMIEMLTAGLKGLTDWFSKNKTALAELAQNLRDIATAIADVVKHPINKLGEFIVSPFTGRNYYDEGESTQINGQVEVDKKYKAMMEKKAEDKRIELSKLAKQAADEQAERDRIRKEQQAAEKKAIAEHNREMIAHSKDVIKNAWEKASTELMFESAAKFSTTAMNGLNLGGGKLAGVTTNPILSLGVDTQLKSLEQIAEKTKELTEAEKLAAKAAEELRLKQQAAFDATAAGGMTNAIKRYSDMVKDTGRQMDEAWTQGVYKMEDAITNSIVKMKLDFKSLFQFIQTEAVRIAIARPLTNAISGAFQPGTTAGVNGATQTVAAGSLASYAVPILGAITAVSLFAGVMDSNRSATEAARRELERVTKELKDMGTAARSVILTSQGQSNEAERVALQAKVDERNAAALRDLNAQIGVQSARNIFGKNHNEGTSVVNTAQSQYDDVIKQGSIELQLLQDKQDLAKNSLTLTEMELKGLKDSAEYTSLLSKIREAEMYNMDDSNKAIQRRIYALQDEAEATKKVTAAMSKTVDVAISAANAIRDIQGGSLSTDSPEQKYRKAMAAFSTNTDASKAGELGKAALAASQQYNASGAGYQSDYLAVMSKLQGYAGMTGSNTAEQQLSVLTEIRDALKDNTDLKEQNKILLALLNVNQTGLTKISNATEATADATTTTAQKSALSAAA